MKKTFGLLGVIVLSFLAINLHAQQTETQPTQPVQQTWDPQNNPTVAAISAKYKDKMINTKAALTNEDIFPALGVYESVSNPEAAMVTITLDEDNKGVVWIQGLPQGKIKAMLRNSPSTYKIPAQKTAEGKDVAEGTLIFDKEMNALSISIGKEYNAADPSIAFVTDPEVAEPVTSAKSKATKTKKVTTPKAWIYTGSKMVKEVEVIDTDVKQELN